jgi:hypothetical protein
LWPTSPISCAEEKRKKGSNQKASEAGGQDVDDRLTLMKNKSFSILSILRRLTDSTSPNCEERKAGYT